MRPRNGTSRPVVVLGPGRSGTSTVSGILAILGVDMGDTDWMAADRWNRLGYFEDRGFFELNEAILAAAGGGWDDPPPRDAVLAQRERFRERIEAEVAGRAGLWGWKDPRTALTVDLYASFLADARVVVVTRNPLHAASSLARRNREITIPRGLDLTAEYLARMFDFVTANPGLPTVFVAYEDVVSEPVEEGRRLAQFLDVPYDTRAREEVAAFVTPRGLIEHEREERAQRELARIKASRAWKATTVVQRLKHRVPVVRRF